MRRGALTAKPIGVLLVLGCLLLLAEGCLAPQPAPRHYQETALPQKRVAKFILDQVATDLASHPQSRETTLLQRFYQANAGLPAWINRQGISLAAYQLIKVLEDADREGLPPQRYEPAALKRLLMPPAAENEPYLGWPPETIAHTDIALSRAFMRYAGDLLWGQERSWRSRVDWHRSRREVDPCLLLSLALEMDAMPSALRGLPPIAPAYQRLRAALQDYRELAELGGWPVLPSGATLHPGETDPRLPDLRRRLRIEGDLSGAGEDSALFDPVTVAALRHFQKRHGLLEDGTLGPQTLKALNIPVEARVDQLLRNMERWRWELPSGSAPEVRVNLADFSLEISAAQEHILRMPVVIGRNSRQTPLFASRLEALIVSPYWYVPPTLLRETLPRIAADDSYLRRNHYEVVDSAGELIRAGSGFGRKWERGEVDASLRQQPGPWNPMGRIKFLLPNPWAIYLHDTPRRELFEHTVRAFSSGCIRLGEPQRLARWLLRNNDWEEERISVLIDSGASRLVEFEKPVALRIGYWTAWVDEGGMVNFRGDVYGRDRSLARELRQRWLPQPSAHI